MRKKGISSKLLYRQIKISDAINSSKSCIVIKFSRNNRMTLLVDGMYSNRNLTWFLPTDWLIDFMETWTKTIECCATVDLLVDCSLISKAARTEWNQRRRLVTELKVETISLNLNELSTKTHHMLLIIINKRFFRQRFLKYFFHKLISFLVNFAWISYRRLFVHHKWL